MDTHGVLDKALKKINDFDMNYGLSNDQEQQIWDLAEKTFEGLHKKKSEIYLTVGESIKLFFIKAGLQFVLVIHDWQEAGDEDPDAGLEPFEFPFTCTPAWIDDEDLQLELASKFVKDITHLIHSFPAKD